MGRLTARGSIARDAVALWAAAFVVWSLGGCESVRTATPADDGTEVPRTVAGEVPCAWFADERDGVLWFGVSGFWSAQRRAGGDPLADLAQPAPRFLGRHEFGRDVGTRFLRQPGGPYPSGIWDVLAHPNGRVYYTTFFDAAGMVDADGRFETFAPETVGLNELALGPAGRILSTRYGASEGPGGAVVVLGEDGRVQAELPLEDPPGYRTAAKSLAWDPVRSEIWVNTDLFPEEPGSPASHDTRILSPGGRELLRWREPEVQFMTFGADGTGYFAERSGSRLRLRIRPAEAAASAVGTGRWVGLDDDFPAHDFVQEVRVAADGRAVVTRWSGRIHVVSQDGKVRDVQIPRREGDLVYTGVLSGDRVCATVCRTRQAPSPRDWVACAEVPD